MTVNCFDLVQFGAFVGYETVADSDDYFAADFEVIFEEEVVGAVYTALDGVFDGNNSMVYVSGFDAFEDVVKVFAGLHVYRLTEKAVNCALTISAKLSLKSNPQHKPTISNLIVDWKARIKCFTLKIGDISSGDLIHRDRSPV
jgi:hypothetical protein